MILHALLALCVPFKQWPGKWFEVSRGGMNDLPRYGLARVQFEGPWTEPGANLKWVALHTHWIGAATFGNNNQMIYDVNCGWVSRTHWAHTESLAISKFIPRASGRFHITNTFELFPE